MHKTEDLSIHSIYLATEGEGLLVGTPQVFVRFQGCAVGCLNCDSRETWDFQAGKKYPVSELVEQIDQLASEHHIKWVSITGGDPLHPRFEAGLLLLCKKLKKGGYSLALEASGTRVVEEVFDLVDSINFDFKTPSTGVRTAIKLVQQVIDQYEGKYQIKSVVANRADFDAVLTAFNQLKANHDIKWVITPCFDPATGFKPELFKKIFDWNYQSKSIFRVIGQQHKFIYGTDDLRI